MQAQHYDAVVIGSGHGENPLARPLAGAGRKTTIIERGHVGGACINEGCTPTKTMVASVRTAYVVRRCKQARGRRDPATSRTPSRQTCPI